jgi:hypothetical protein
MYSYSLRQYAFLPGFDRTRLKYQLQDRSVDVPWVGCIEEMRPTFYDNNLSLRRVDKQLDLFLRDINGVNDVGGSLMVCLESEEPLRSLIPYSTHVNPHYGAPHITKPLV